MDIGRTDGIAGPAPVDPNRKVGKASKASGPSGASPSDKVEISQDAKLFSEILSMPSTRSEKIEAVRSLLNSGEYESDERLEGALEAFLKEHPELLGEE